MSTPNEWLELNRRKINAWNNAVISPKYDSNQVRVDAHGSFMIWSEYGKRTKYGWEIDHELPRAHFPGFANTPANLRAMHWQNNRTKSDNIDLATALKLLGGQR